MPSGLVFLCIVSEWAALVGEWPPSVVHFIGWQDRECREIGQFGRSNPRCILASPRRGGSRIASIGHALRGIPGNPRSTKPGILRIVVGVISDCLWWSSRTLSPCVRALLRHAERNVPVAPIPDIPWLGAPGREWHPHGTRLPSARRQADRRRALLRTAHRAIDVLRLAPERSRAALHTAPQWSPAHPPRRPGADRRQFGQPRSADHERRDEVRDPPEGASGQPAAQG